MSPLEESKSGLKYILVVKGETNWKYILIVVILAAIVGAIALFG